MDVSDFEGEPWSPIHVLPSGVRVFHYTSAAGLMGIFQSGTAWATEASGLNDVAEVVEGRRHVAACIDQLPVGELRDELTSALNHVYEANGPGPSDVFVLSASLQEDDANQWRLYADHGRGFCIEFDTHVPLTVRARTELANAEPPDPGTGNLNLGFMRDVSYVSPWSRVLYHEEERSLAFTNLLEWAEGAYDLAANADWAGPESGDLPPLQVLNYEMSRAIASLTRCIKGPGFAGEAEARIHVSSLWGDHHAHFRHGADGIVRHYELMASIPSAQDAHRVTLWTDADPLPIRSVRLGPAQRFELVEPAMRSLLSRCGYGRSVEVTASRVSLR